MMQICGWVVDIVQCLFRSKFLLVRRQSMKLAYIIWMTRNLVNIMSGNCKRQNIWFPTLKLTRENMAQRNQYHSFFLQFAESLPISEK